jgi:molecular chaperone DnaJ
MPKRDYYEVLGVERSAPASEIKSAYRKAALKLHPDRNPGDREAEERFKEAAEAYAVLSDDNRRARYDRFGHEGVSTGGMGGFDPSVFADFSDILGDFFGMGDIFGGFGRRSRGPRRGADLAYDLELDLEEAVFGGEQTFALPRVETCERCEGTGAADPSDVVRCSACGGAGQQVFRQGFLSMARSCSTCRGSGTVVRRPCEECGGNGRIRRERRLGIEIPPGADTGSRLRVRGEGEVGEPGGPAGDLYITVHVREHPVFQREGHHLLCEIPITFSQAGLGTEVEVPLLGGSTKTLKIPAGTQTGSIFRIRGEGVRDRRGAGDLHVRAKVRTPARLSPEGRQALEDLAASRDEELGEEDRGLFQKVKDIFS